MSAGLYGVAVASDLGDHYAPPDQVGAALAATEVVTPLISLDAVDAVLVRALTDVVASLPLTLPPGPGALWRNSGLVTISSNLDGSSYVAPAGDSLSGALDPLTALLTIAAPAALRGQLPVRPPTEPGALWLDNAFLVLSPRADGSPFPTTPLPTGGVGLLPLVRAALIPWLTAAMPAMPRLAPLSRSRLWRANDFLAVS